MVRMYMYGALMCSRAQALIDLSLAILIGCRGALLLAIYVASARQSFSIQDNSNVIDSTFIKEARQQTSKVPRLNIIS